MSLNNTNVIFFFENENVFCTCVLFRLLWTFINIDTRPILINGISTKEIIVNLKSLSFTLQQNMPVFLVSCCITNCMYNIQFFAELMVFLIFRHCLPAINFCFKSLPLLQFIFDHSNFFFFFFFFLSQRNAYIAVL